MASRIDEHATPCPRCGAANDHPEATHRHEDLGPAQAREDARPMRAIEAEKPLSESLLWKLQRAYFDTVGVRAWSSADVPHYVTNNPALAGAYAAVFAGFLRDVCAGAFDPREPVTVVELGAGSGRFGYAFLRALSEITSRGPLSGVRYRYVMTDFTRTNLDHWGAHASLKPFVDQGVLDFALFDGERSRAIHLVHADTTLSPGSLANPLCVIANYALGVLPQDAFSFEGGRLHERVITLLSREDEIDPSKPIPLEDLGLSYASRPISSDRYEEPELNAILAGYAERLEGQTVLFPSAAIRCIERLAALAGGRVVVIAGDRAQMCEDALDQGETLGIGIHAGSFSFESNFHAIAEYVRARKGHVLDTGHRHKHLLVSAFLLGEHPTDWAETHGAFELAVEQGCPDDLFSMRQALRGNYERLSMSQLLSVIQLSRWDPVVVAECLPGLWKQLPSASEMATREVVTAVMRAWESYFHVGEEHDLAFELGLLLHGYGAFPEALELFRASARLYGEDARTSWNMGLCHFSIGAVEEAIACFRDATRIDPTFVPARAVQVKE